MTGIVVAISTLLAFLPRPTVGTELQYDVLIHNTVWSSVRVDECSEWQVTFEQIGGLDFLDGDYRWQWWRPVKVTGLPIKDRGGYVVRWYDAHHDRSYTVRSRLYWHTDSRQDLELQDRAIWPIHCRRGLKD